MIKIIGRNVPSKKNSKQWTGKCLISSKSSREYDKWIQSILLSMLPQWEKDTEGLSYPLRVGIYFYRDSRRRWDFNNISQSIADNLVAAGYIPDDDTTHFIPVYIGEEVTPKPLSGFHLQILSQ